MLRVPQISSDAMAQIALCNQIVRLLAERDRDAADRKASARSSSDRQRRSRSTPSSSAFEP
jgi:hypothetical protein